MSRKLVAIFVIISMAMIFTFNANALSFGKGANLLGNGDFEKDQNKFPKDWRSKDDPLPPTVMVEISQDNPHSGKHCLMINNIEPADTMLLQNLKVKEEKVYLITCWIRTESVAQQAGSANVTLFYGDLGGGVEGILTSQEFADTGNQWVKLEFPFRARKTKTPLMFGVRFGGQGTANQGKVFFDDVEVKEVANRDDAIGFYVPGEAAQETPSGPSPFVPSKTLIFIIIGTLVVGFLVFLEFNLSQKEKKEQAEAEPKNEVGQSEQIVGEGSTDQVAEKTETKIDVGKADQGVNG